MGQQIFCPDNGYIEFLNFLKHNCKNGIFLVCGKSAEKLNIYRCLMEVGNDIKIFRFSDFQPNPTYESVVNGLREFSKSNSNLILAIGGGSAIDVAKCIKLFSGMDTDNDSDKGSYLNQKPVENDVILAAVSTTAGSGSESTRYAVIYYEGIKQSITNDKIIPEAVLLDPSVLELLPDYQRKSTMMDALCHAIESYWSVNSTDESKSYSMDAICLILNNMDGYLINDSVCNKNMMEAAHLAGKAINITQTTAGHAMAYNLTKEYGIAHGHAVALCVKELWPWMIDHMNHCIDPRGSEYLHDVFCELASAFDCQGIKQACGKYARIVDRLKLRIPNETSMDVVKGLAKSVNVERLENNPVAIKYDHMIPLYEKILDSKGRNGQACYPFIQ